MSPGVKRIFARLLVAGACLVLLTIVAFAIWRVRLANNVERRLATIRAAGLPTSGEEANTYYTPVPDNENAAVKMAEAFALITNYSDSRSNDVEHVKFPPRTGTLSSDESNLLAGYCALNSNALAQAEVAVKLSRSRYPMDLSWGAGTLLPHLQKLKDLALLAAYRSVLDTNSSAMEIATIIGMARTLDAEPILISKLVRIALLSIAAKTLERRLNVDSLTDNELKLLSELFTESAKTNQIANGLIGERAMTIGYFRMSYAEMNRLAHADENGFSQQGGPPLPGPQPFVYKLTGFFERDLRFYLQTTQTNIWLEETHQFDFALITNIQNQTWTDARRNLFILSSLLLPAYGSASTKEAKNLAQLRTVQTALAIERFRSKNEKLPNDLSVLVPQFLSAVPKDPFDGRPLRYKRLEKGYVIYSVDEDGQDNGGRERPPDAKSSDKTPYDITFTVER